MHIPRFMRNVNRVLTNPILGTVAWIVERGMVTAKRQGRLHLHGAKGVAS